MHVLNYANRILDDRDFYGNKKEDEFSFVKLLLWLTRWSFFDSVGMDLSNHAFGERKVAALGISKSFDSVCHKSIIFKVIAKNEENNSL